jgi:hypothetical protein
VSALDKLNVLSHHLHLKLDDVVADDDAKEVELPIVEFAAFFF